MKKLISLLACLILATHLLTGCTSKDSKDDSNGDQAVSEDSSVSPDPELDKMDTSAAPADATATADTAGNTANEGFLDDQLPADALGESTAKTDQAPPPTTDAVADATTPPPSMDEPKTDQASTDAAPPPMDATTDIGAPPMDSSASVDTGAPPAIDAPVDSGSSTGSSIASTEPSAPLASPPSDKPKASLKKVEAAPMTRSGILLNAVYVARPKDNFKNISKMIYGSADKAKELKKVNPGLSAKVGDKIYYNSPTRPTDDTKVLTYYEDAGMVPEVYVAKDGDDLKKVSKELLGFDNAWKEVWVTNSVEPKGKLTAGTELRYWKSAPVAAPVAAPPSDMAMNNPPPSQMSPPAPDMPPGPPAAQAGVNNQAAPPPPSQAASDMPPPPPPPDMNAGAPPPPPPAAQAAPDMPPPPPAEAVNPPPPPPMAKKAPKETIAPEGGMDNDMMMSLAGAGIIAAGLAAVIIIRKRRQQKDMQSAFNDTQVGT